MLINKNNIHKIYKAKQASIEDMERQGYELITELFVDSSGLGHEDEPALTTNQVEQKVKECLDIHGTLTAKITGIGQFQVYLGLFKKVKKTRAKWGTNRQTAQAFARGTDDRHSGHMFIENNAIYSYGSHFPMAYRTGKQYQGKNIILFNADKYSNTTASHESDVKQAFDNVQFVHVPTEVIKNYIESDKHEELVSSKARSEAIVSLITTINELDGKELRARKEWNKAYYKQQSTRLKIELDIFQNILVPLHPDHV